MTGDEEHVRLCDYRQGARASRSRWKEATDNVHDRQEEQDTSYDSCSSTLTNGGTLVDMLFLEGIPITSIMMGQQD
jgi:hypothetical protein